MPGAHIRIHHGVCQGASSMSLHGAEEALHPQDLATADASSPPPSEPYRPSPGESAT